MNLAKAIAKGMVTRNQQAVTANAIFTIRISVGQSSRLLRKEPEANRCFFHLYKKIFINIGQFTQHPQLSFAFPSNNHSH